MELSRWYHHRFPWLLSAAPDGAGEPPPGSLGTRRVPPPRRALLPQDRAPARKQLAALARKPGQIGERHALRR